MGTQDHPRPADFLTEVSWFTAEAWEPPLHLSAVLRSWEDRFGAFGDRTWVTHPSEEQVDSVADIASLIIGQPIWGFWWD